MKITREQALIKEKHGIKLWVYPTASEDVSVCIVVVEEGHFEEFYHTKSTFIYYIIEGEGTFFLNGEATPAKSGDLVVIPPMTKIYYLGKMKMTLTTVPAWTEEHEVHVRFVENIKK